MKSGKLVRAIRDREALRVPARTFVIWLHRSGHRELLTRELFDSVNKLQGTVIDIGGGRDSPLAHAWSSNVARYRFDIVPARSRHVQADACAMPVSSESIDGALMSEVLEHIAEPQSAIDEVFRILKPGGQFIGSVPFLCQGIHADPHDYYRYTEPALRRMLGKFERVEVIPHGNGLGVAWRMILGRAKFLLPLNPLLRKVGRKPDPFNAEGYVFRAWK